MIDWIQHLPDESMNLLFFVAGVLSALGIASDIWKALQVEDSDDAEVDHIR